jgi:hypothetical protein
MVEEADNIVRILKETRAALDSNDSYKLKTLSDQTIHSSAIYQDTDNIITAVIVYSLSKIMERDNYKKMEGWDKFYAIIIKNIDEAIVNAEKGNFEKFATNMGRIRNSINEVDTNLSNYIRDVFYKAGINKAFKLYEHGLSAETTASLLGVSLWDLASYIGQTTISESHYGESVPVKERIKLIEDFLK